MKISRSALLFLLGIASVPAVLAQSAGCCTHQGRSVMCPSGLPAGSRSLEFVQQGTLWGTPSGQSVMVPSTSFASCPQPTSQPAPAASPPPAVATTPRAPAPAASAVTATPATTPPVTSAPATADQPRTSGSPNTTTTTRERRDGDRSRPGPTVRIPGSPPAGPPVVAVPVTPSAEEGGATDAAIGRMGSLLKAQEKEKLASEVGGTCARDDKTAKGGSGVRISKSEEDCSCEEPGVKKKDARKGGGKGGRKGGGGGGDIQVDVGVAVNWNPVARPVRISLGPNSGLVSGVTTYGGIAMVEAQCKVDKTDCRGNCEKVIYESIHMHITANITYVRGMRDKAAHEAVHARQMRDVFQTALDGIPQTQAYPCAPPKDSAQRLRLCQARLEAQARRVGTAAIEAWQRAREGFKTSAANYRSDPTEVEARGGENAAFPDGVEPPDEFKPPPAPPAAAGSGAR
jgi:hypothetical protein